MADLALVVIAIDELWGRWGRVPESDRAQVLCAATAGIHFALQTGGDEAGLRTVCRLLHLDAIPIVGPGLHTERNGRVLVEAAVSPEPVLEALVAELAGGIDPFGREHILVIAAADSPLYRAGGLRAWIPTDAQPPVADYIAGPGDRSNSGVAEILTALAMRNNRFLRPPTTQRRFLVL